MGRPRLIIIIRHGQSEGNKNRDIHQTIPDHRVKLTPDGWAQAREAGQRLRSMLRADDTLHFFTSPYRRTRDTTEGILETLTSDEPGPSSFRRADIKVYEEPRLREQDFGNFQPCSAEMERMWQERADYGHFFYRIPDGESAADAYDRISGFNESMWRQFGEDDFPSVCVLVTHGLMSRVFLMKWYHFSVEYFEDLRNINHCELLIMHREDNGKYTLQNKLRTWSELRQERLAQKEKEKEKDKDKSVPKLDRQNSSPVPRKWGGCPGGCNHGKNGYKIRRDLTELRLVDERNSASNSSTCSTSGSGSGTGHSSGASSTTVATRRPQHKRPNNSDDDSDDPRGLAPPDIDVTRAREEVISSPDGTPSFITVENRLRAHIRSPLPSPKAPLRPGRDFGGTHSGGTSANSDTELSEEDAVRKRLAVTAARVKGPKSVGTLVDDETGLEETKTASVEVLVTSTAGKNSSRSATKMLNDATSKEPPRASDPDVSGQQCTDKLGDASPSCSERESEDGEDGWDEGEDISKEEKADRSIKGSVY